MVIIAAVLGVLVALALVAKTYSWRVKGAIFVALVAMVMFFMR